MTELLSIGTDGPEPDAAERPPAAPTRRWYHRLVRDETGVVGVLVVLVLGVGLLHPDFLLRANLLSTARSSVYVGLLAAGMVFPLAMREVDLSVGGTFALSMVFGAVLVRSGLDPWLALPLVLLAGAGLGALNGLVTTYARIPSFIVTLAAALLYRGVALALSDGKQIFDLPQRHAFFTVLGGDVAGVPTAIWLLVLIGAALTVLFTKTRFGAQVRAIGSNPEAAAFTGIPVDRLRILSLALSGLVASASGALALAFFIAGDPTLGTGFDLTAIAAAIIGGTALAGGRGSVPGAITGALILSTVSSSLVFFRVPINWNSFATGAVILFAVAADAALRRYRTSARRQGLPG
jgi:ribose transport system permease protein